MSSKNLLRYDNQTNKYVGEGSRALNEIGAGPPENSETSSLSSLVQLVLIQEVVL
jgi:hypothetical protein